MPESYLPSDFSAELHVVGLPDIQYSLTRFVAMDSDASLVLSCPGCAARMPETAAYCPGCGRPMPVARPSIQAAGRLPANLAAAISYMTFIPAIVLLSLDPYRKSRFVRFHSIQCLLLWLFLLAVLAWLKLAALALSYIPVAGPLLIVLLFAVAGLAAFLLWVVLVVKALWAEMFKLPVLGAWAERLCR